MSSGLPPEKGAKMFAVSLDRVRGRSTTGQYFYGGTMQFSKFGTMTEAKEEVSDAFKSGYFNHARIYDQSDRTEIERFSGGEWTRVC